MFHHMTLTFLAKNALKCPIQPSVFLTHKGSAIVLEADPQQHQSHHGVCKGRKGHQDSGTAAPRGHAVLGYQRAPVAHTHITD